MMTGQIKMDNSTSENVNGVNSSNEESLHHDKLEDNGVATLDVTSEEIYCNQKGWSSSPVFPNEPTVIEEENPVERERSRTWTSGLSEHVTNKKLSLNGKNSLRENLQTSEHQQLSGNPASEKEVLPVETTSLQMQTMSTLDCDSLSITGSIPNGSISEKHKITVDDMSGFTDVSLARSITSIEDKEESVVESINEKASTAVEVQSRKHTLGSIFEWMSPSRNDSIVSDLCESSEMSTSGNPPTSPSKYSGMKLIQKTFQSTFSRKVPRKNNFQLYSTTALILEDRPSNLPSKSAVESEKHRAEYEKMIENAKKIGIKDVKKRREQMKHQEKLEKTIVNSSYVWLTEILPKWNTVYQTNRTRHLWWQGLPPNVRGKVWQLAIGNELNITNELYSIMVTRAHEKLKVMSETQSLDAAETDSLAADRECTVELIRLDVSRTFPHLCIFQKGGPYHELLHDVLGAYVCYRPDVGYVQGMSFMAAMLLLNMEPAEAFVTFANLLNKPCQVAFFRLNEELMQTYFAAFEVFFEENLPRLFAHFKQNNLTPDMYLIDWIFTMFSKALDLDTASRVWDVFCRDGDEFLFRTAIAILKLNRDLLLSMEFIQAAQYLTRLPSTFTHAELFNVIGDVTMTSRSNRRWKDVLSLMRDAT